MPKYWERPIQYPPSKKNYIQINAKQVDQMSNPKPHTHVVDGKDGHLLSLDHSGLIPEYVSKPVKQTKQLNNHYSPTVNILKITELW